MHNILAGQTYILATGLISKNHAADLHFTLLLQHVVA